MLYGIGPYFYKENNQAGTEYSESHWRKGSANIFGYGTFINDVKIEKYMVQWAGR
jgi:hypothetical protein